MSGRGKPSTHGIDEIRMERPRRGVPPHSPLNSHRYSRVEGRQIRVAPANLIFLYVKVVADGRRAFRTVVENQSHLVAEDVSGPTTQADNVLIRSVPDNLCDRKTVSLQHQHPC